MNVYRWCARDKQGKKFRGELRAGNEEEVAEFIRSNYGYVTKIQKIRHWEEVYANFRSEKLEIDDGIRESFFRQLSALLDGGISLIKGLEMIKLKSRGCIYEISNSLIKNLNRGLSLSAAMNKQKGTFTPASVLSFLTKNFLAVFAKTTAEAEVVFRFVEPLLRRVTSLRLEALISETLSDKSATAVNKGSIVATFPLTSSSKVLALAIMPSA